MKYYITRQNIELLSGLLIAIATVGGAIIAASGLHTWRRQLHGTTEYDLARRLLLHLFQVRDKIKSARSPFLDPAEIENPKDDWEIMAYKNRWERVLNSARELELDTIEAEVLWGDLLKEPLKTYNKKAAELFIVIRRYVSAKQNPAKYPLSEEDEKILYDMGSDNPDEYEQELLKIIQSIEKKVKPFLKK